jgi:GAF domain-containing protein
MTDLTMLHQDLAKVVLVGRDLSDVLTDITCIARKAVPAVDAASITLIRNERGFTAAYDGPLALHADELQYERGYGPCLDAGLSGQVFLVEDMATETRWPDYAQKAFADGVGSSLSVPLPFQSTSIGALNTYSVQSHAYGQEDCVLAEDVAAWIALAVGNAEAAARTGEELTNLRIAMHSRAVIEQAKGMLMGRYKIDENRAFAVLTRTSQTTNVKLREIADELVRTGVLRGADEHF